MLHGARGQLEFTVSPGFAQGKPYVARYLQTAVVHENGKGGEVMAFGGSDETNEGIPF